MISRISSCMVPDFPLLQPRGPGRGVKRAMCRSRRMGPFSRFWPRCRSCMALPPAPKPPVSSSRILRAPRRVTAETSPVSGAFYVPVYSSVSMSQGKLRADFSVTLSVHNASKPARWC